jgi:hypothetical protein
LYNRRQRVEGVYESFSWWQLELLLLGRAAALFVATRKDKKLSRNSGVVAFSSVPVFEPGVGSS